MPGSLLSRVPSKEVKSAFDIIVSVLLSVSLASFLMMIFQRVPTSTGFIVTTIFVTLFYIILIYSFTFFKLKHNHFLLPRTIMVTLFSILPYIVMRTFLVKKDPDLISITAFSPNGFLWYLLVLEIIGLAWGVWESCCKSDRFDLKNFNDARIWIAGVLLIGTIFYFLHVGGYL